MSGEIVSVQWIRIASMETPEGPVEIYQDSETGRVKLPTPVSLLIEKDLGKDPSRILKPDQSMARCFKFFDSFEDMMKWMNKQNLLSSLKFTYSSDCKEEPGKDEYRV